MKRFAFLLAALLAACSPQTLTLQVEMRHPSKSGLELSGKTMAVVCMDASDTVVNTALATGLARSLEKTYFDGETMIPIYRVAADSINLSRMHDLVMDTGLDVIFFFDAPSLGDTLKPQVPLELNLYVYDSMEKADKIHSYTGSTTIKHNFAEQAERMGQQISNRFLPTWKAEGYSLFYYEWEGGWMDAIDHAAEHEWEEAIAFWMRKLNTQKAMTSACASYNIAVGYFMLGDPLLALKWLDQSEKFYPLPLSPGLRKRIQARI